MSEANTTLDIQQIKKSIGEEVVPGVTGKPSRVLKDTKPKKLPKRMTAGGASLHEISAAIQADPTLSVGEAIKIGKQEAKARRVEEEGGGLRRGSKRFLESALGRGLGGWLAGLLDTKSQKQSKAINEAHRKYEEGSKVKADFLRGLLGEKVGGMVARGTTLTSTKVSAFEKYQELTAERFPQFEKEKTAQKTVKPKPEAPLKPKTNPQRDEAVQVLQTLGYKKTEIDQRLQNAPASSTTEQFVRFGLNPTTTAMPAHAAGAEATKQLSEQEQAEKDKKEDDEKEEKKEDQKFKKEVKEELKSIEKNTKKGGSLMNWLIAALIAGVAGLIYEYWDQIMKAVHTISDFYNKTVEFFSRNIIEPIMKFIDFVKEDIYKPIVKLATWLTNASGGNVDAEGGGAVNGALADPDTAKLVPESLGGAPGNDAYIKAISEGKTVPAEARPEVKPVPPHESQRTGIIQRPQMGAIPSKVVPAPMAPATTPRDVAVASEANQGLKKENDTGDLQDVLGNMLLSMISAPDPLGNATLKGVNDIKAALPALAKGNDDGGGIIVKLGNDESSVSGYMGQIFDHPAVWGGKP